MKVSVILDDQQEKVLDVDRSSSANSFSVINQSDEEPDSPTSLDFPINQPKNDFPVISKEKVKLEAPSFNHLMTTNQDALTQIATVNYRGQIIKIFMETNENKNSHRFFFEPMVLLDVDSVSSESHVIFKQEFLKFTIQMWTTELRSRVLDRLKTLPSLWHLMDIQEDDISVMTYENVQLISLNNSDGSINHESIRLMDQASSYQRMNENLDFYFICDSATMAKALAQDFKKNPEFTLKTWQLSVVCRGTQPMMSKNYTISVPSNRKSSEKHYPSLTSDSSNVIPVFSVKGCTNPKASNNESFAYSITDFETKTEHGDFDLSSGIFTVKTTGLYHLQFTAHIETNKWVNYHRYDLRVDGIYKAVSFTQTSSENEQHQAIIISAYLPLKSGEKVGIFRVEGGLYEDIYHVSRFVGILLSSY